jgi:succinate dehydrogenase / fumarate reductase cytochrome b subunit
MPRSSAARPVYRNIRITDLLRYRLPLPGIVSILHRISGALLFVFLWLLLWMLQSSVGNHEQFRSLYANPLVKLILFVLLWSLLHHLCAGIRYLVLDVSHSATDLKPTRQSSAIVLVVSIVLTLIIGVKLW